MITLEGSDGGGQLLRTALALSLITGKAFRMTRIRGARPKPGLMRQHLTCVLAAQEVGDASVDGAAIGSQEIVFTPGKIRSGDFQFAIGTGGSTTLVLQTLLPALLHAAEPSTVRIEGGTHNPMAPPFEFIDQCFLPVLHTMGVKAKVTCERIGFMQVGGGSIFAEFQPLKKWKKLALLERGALVEHFGCVMSAHLPTGIEEREIRAASKTLDWEPDLIKRMPANLSKGPGNILMLGARFENVLELSSSVAQMGRSAENVAESAARGLKNYLSNEAAVGVNLADQLLLPMALSGGGKFTTFALSNHTKTSMELIPKFVDVHFAVKEGERGVKTISVKSA